MRIKTNFYSVCQNNAQWQCENKECPATCSVYGNSHVSTFDDKEYGFRGSCEYIIVQSTKSNQFNFTVTARNELCDSRSVSCPKHLDIIIGKIGTPKYHHLELESGKCIH